MIFGHINGMLHFFLEEKFRILECAMNIVKWKTHDAVEKRMQSANKAFWKDILIYKNQDLPWEIKCQRLVDQVCAVWGENWSWTKQTKGWWFKPFLSNVVLLSRTTRFGCFVFPFAFPVNRASF